MKALKQIPIVGPDGVTRYLLIEDDEPKQKETMSVQEIYAQAHEVLEQSVTILARTHIHKLWWRKMGMVLLEKRYIKKGKYKFPKPETLAKQILKQ